MPNGERQSAWVLPGIGWIHTDNIRLFDNMIYRTQGCIAIICVQLQRSSVYNLSQSSQPAIDLADHINRGGCPYWPHTCHPLSVRQQFTLSKLIDCLKICIAFHKEDFYFKKKQTKSSYIVLKVIKFSVHLYQMGRWDIQVVFTLHLCLIFGLKVHKIENFFGFDFEICTFSQILRHTY